MMNENTFCCCCLSTECYKNVSLEYVIDNKKEIYGEMLLHTYNINVSIVCFVFFSKCIIFVRTK